MSRYLVPGNLRSCSRTLLAAANPAGGAATRPGRRSRAAAAHDSSRSVLIVPRARPPHRHASALLGLARPPSAERASGLPALGRRSPPRLAVGLADHGAVRPVLGHLAASSTSAATRGRSATPAHYFILAGLYRHLRRRASSRCACPIAAAEPDRACRSARDWHAPLGRRADAACAAASRCSASRSTTSGTALFGQDVDALGPDAPDADRRRRDDAARRSPSCCVEAGRVEAPRARSRGAVVGHASAPRSALPGGLLHRLMSTFQLEFDFGVPQFRLRLRSRCSSWSPPASCSSRADPRLGPRSTLGAVAVLSRSCAAACRCSSADPRPEPHAALPALPRRGRCSSEGVAHHRRDEARRSSSAPGAAC